MINASPDAWATTGYCDNVTYARTKLDYVDTIT